MDWYIHAPQVKHDFRSSGLTNFKYHLDLGETDLSANFAHGNPRTIELLAKMYRVQAENVFVSSEGASGQNARVIRFLAEVSRGKREAIVEYPTYEPLLRQVQEHFAFARRLERTSDDANRLDADKLRRIVSKKTGLLVLTNPHAPSGAISDRKELQEIMSVASENGFHVLCDEIYAEFDRKAVPSVFSIDPEFGVVTTSFTKAYGLGGLKLGTVLAEKQLVDGFYTDVLNTVGNSPNVVQLIAANLLANGMKDLETHRRKWIPMKNETEKWLRQQELEFFPSKAGVTYWVKLPIENTYKWINERAIRQFGLALVPGAFFLFKSDYRLARSNMVRLGLGAINPNKSSLHQGLEALEEAVDKHGLK